MNNKEAMAAIVYQPATGRGEKRSSTGPPLNCFRLFVHRKSLFPAGALGQRNRIQHRGRLVAEHREAAPDGAGGFVMPVAPRRVEVATGAGHQRNRPSIVRTTSPNEICS